MSARDEHINRLDALSEAPEPATDPTVDRRTFSRGIGFLMQGLGATLFMLTTCACCGIAFFEGGAMHRGIIDIEGEASGSAVRAQIVLVASVLGSLALVAFGLGQQSDRGRLPSLGTALTATLLAVGYIATPLLDLGPQSRPAIVVGAAWSLAIIFALAAAAAWLAVVQVFEYPPQSSAAPTVPADAFPDPLARPRERHDSPAEADLARRRRHLEEELRQLDEVERQVRKQQRPDE